MAHAIAIPRGISRTVGREKEETVGRSSTKQQAKEVAQQKAKAGTKLSAKASAKVAEVREKFRNGKLKSGKTGKIVTSPKQALAIALAERDWQNSKDHNGGVKGAMKKYKAPNKGKVTAGVGATVVSEEKKRKKKKKK